MAQNSAFDDEELTLSLSETRHNHQHNIIHSQTPIDPAPIAQSSHGRSHPRRSQAGVRSKSEQRIDAYHVVRTLGEGSFGKVKLAIHKVTGQHVALKIIARKRLISRDMAGRVEREIEYLQLLRHPHIIKLYTVIKTAHEIIMVLEYAGSELFDFIVQHGCMKEAMARRFFQQIICAVEYCHRHKIVHRDLKPENLLLLENTLEVKIADFGLSNIMTDGNFLKTSCGSPNYAAPEVIGGKLYAGPEVDVWSCGVILYVMLVGRLPFDDDNIPRLFAKIARGTYSVPQWLSQEATALIKKMLVVNPVHRATIEEIRDDPWFTKDIPAYLQHAPEDLLNTGIDPNRAIRKSDIAPGASASVVEKLHDEVTEKISKTMGYSKADVEEALAAEEASAIKDAYMIVRENKLMELTQGSISSVTASAAAARLTDSPQPSNASSTRSGLSSTTSARPYISKVGILPTSIPAYHRAYMERGREAFDPNEVLESHQPTGTAPTMTEAEKEEFARRLKSRPTLLRDESANASTTPGAGPTPTATPVSRPEGLTPANLTKKPKLVRWQFGIRSRNAPWEALLCIHKALHKLGATYLRDEDYEKAHEQQQEEERQRQEEQQHHQQQQRQQQHQADEPGSSRFTDDELMGSDIIGGDEVRSSQNISVPASASIAGGRSSTPKSRYKLPADPWHIRVRWEVKQGTFQIRSTIDGQLRSFTAMHMDIQIYEMDPGVYLVDFKCSGYETAQHELLEHKDVSSPFPFLDMAARLIMQLAD